MTVVLILVCPNSSWMYRRSVPDSNRWVAKDMRCDTLLDAGPLCGACDLVLYGPGGDVPVPAISGGEEPIVGSFHPDVLPEDLQHHRGEHDIAVLPALPLPDVDLARLRINVRHLQAGGLAHPEPPGVEHEGDGPVFRGLQSRQETLHLRLGQDLG